MVPQFDGAYGLLCPVTCGWVVGFDELGMLTVPILHLGGWCVYPKTVVQALHLFMIINKSLEGSRGRERSSLSPWQLIYRR